MGNTAITVQTRLVKVRRGQLMGIGAPLDLSEVIIPVSVCK